MLDLAGFAKLGLCITGYAIHGPVFTRLEWDFSSLAAFCADCSYHLAGSSVPTVGSPGLPAGLTALRLIGIALGSEEFLFLSGECETGPTFRALDSLVVKTHWTTSL